VNKAKDTNGTQGEQDRRRSEKDTGGVGVTYKDRRRDLPDSKSIRRAFREQVYPDH
jgi:hypothetical protein